jgi:2-succinyl-5-enolpyruvyl-6-hydroxy-3-cyclohexene-1-carboxylate synthase
VKLPPANINHFWASILVEELIRNGTDYFCLAPGSRCAPLTVAIAENPRARTSIHYDERGVGFHALGYGRATGRPAAVVTTSGTAVSNLTPAVVEASMERIPMLLLTADRPPELRDTCANQTIDQVKSFGDYVRWFVDLACPETGMPPEMVLTTVDQAAYRCRWPLGGPVHINCMFREPLAPEPQDKTLNDEVAAIDGWLARKGPFTDYALPEKRCSSRVLEMLAARLAQTERGLVVVGGLRNDLERTAVSALLEALKWPACVDITSGLRMGDGSGTVIGHYDALLRNKAFVETHRPEVILHMGGRLVSKLLGSFLSQSAPADYMLVADHPERQDPGHEVTVRVEAGLSTFCADLASRLPSHNASLWLASWRQKAKVAHRVLDRFAQTGEDLSEPVVAFLLSRIIPKNHALFLANSMPVRDMDIFSDGQGAGVCVGANRGASGIDGTIACASGFAAGLQGPVTLLIGDLAFLHDLNALNYLRNVAHPVVAVVLNNNGGGIFSFLPIAHFERFLEPYFVTPHGLTFEHAASMYGLAYYQPGTRRDFVRCYKKALKSKKSVIVEVSIEREENLATHTRILTDMQRALEP